MTYSHPKATIIECKRSGVIIHTIIQLDRTEGGPVAPSGLWSGDPPMKRDAKCIFTLHKLNKRDGQMYYFETYENIEPQNKLPINGEKYYFVGWWRKDQLETAHMNKDAFQKYLFIAKTPSDHDHCLLCWNKIGQSEGEEHEAYKQENNSVCIDCYKKYIESGFGIMLGEAAQPAR